MNEKRKPRRGARVRYLLKQIPKTGDTTRNKELYRFLLLILAAVAIDFAFPVSPVTEIAHYEEGVVADQDVIAPISFPVYKSEEELSRERNAAASSAEPIFDHKPEFTDSAIASAAAFFAAVDSVAATVEQDSFRTLRTFLEEGNIPAPGAAASVLVSEETRRSLQAAVSDAFDVELRGGVASSGDLGIVTARSVIVRRDTTEQRAARDSLRTLQQFYQDVAARLPADIDGEERRIFNTMVIRFAQPTIRLNREATDVAQEQARRAIDPVQYSVLEGEIIVREHERVGPEDVERLQALEAELGGGEQRQDIPARVGGFFYNLLLILVFGIVLKYYRPQVYLSNRSVTLVWILLLAVAAAAALISRAGWPPQLIPIAFAALVIATLYDGMLALLAVFVIVALVVARPPIYLVVLFPTVIGGAAAALSGRVVRRRAYTWASAAIIALAYVAAAICLALITRQGLLWTLESSFWGMLNAFGCVVLAAGIMPLAEQLTRITTRPPARSAPTACSRVLASTIMTSVKSRNLSSTSKTSRAVGIRTTR
jgi:membrane-associated HD superfamily phosphohydrolase